MSYYVKLIVLPIKTIPRSLTLFVLLISAFYQHDMSHNNADIRIKRKELETWE